MQITNTTTKTNTQTQPYINTQFSNIPTCTPLQIQNTIYFQLQNIHFSIQSLPKYQSKFGETATCTASDLPDLDQQFDNPVMRKSSLKSSQESKQILTEQEKKAMQQSRHKSQSELNNEGKTSVSEESFDLYKHSWLTNKKTISAESINCEELDVVEGPDSWDSCTIQLTNTQKTKEYTLQCNQIHNLISVAKRLAKLEKLSANNFKILFHDENSQRMASDGCTMLEIAKSNQTQIIHLVFE